MNRKRRPNGRENIVASAALERLNVRAAWETEMTALATLIPGASAWRSNNKGAIRLIDLERRARFARRSRDPN